MTCQPTYMDAHLSKAEMQFFALLRLALGGSAESCLAECRVDWKAVYKLAEKQSVVGLCFAGIEKLPRDRMPGMELLMQWLGYTEHIKSKNAQVTAAVAEVRKHFEGLGMQMVLLKGQGNGVYYGPLANLRTPGDIDAWIFPIGSEKLSHDELLRNDERVLTWLWKRDPQRRHCYIHTDYPAIGGADVEMHFRPSYLNSPRRNRRLQHWFADRMAEQAWEEVTLPDSEVRVSIPTVRFNLVYQHSHLYRHIFDDGLGLRQVVDYYMLLRSASQQDKEEVQKEIQELGMHDFAAALMFVLHEALGMEKGELLCAPDERRGQFLLQEIMLAGNFGHYDERTIRFKHDNGVTRLLRRQWRNMRFIWDYPAEVLSVPIYRVYQEIWRWKMNRKCK